VASFCFGDASTPGKTNFNQALLAVRT